MSSPKAASIATWVTLAAAIAINFRLEYPFFASTGQDWDAIHLYQPLARGLLAGGLSFFGEEASVTAPPFSYAWHAMFGASIPAVRWANFILSAFTLCLVFRSAWLLHSRLAGLLAALLFAVCPLLKEFLATPITEGPFIFFCACWFWAMCEWFSGGRRAYVVVAGVALTLAVLTRAALEYWILVGIAAFAWAAWRGQGEPRTRAKGALAAHLIAFVVPAAFTAKNVAIFGVAFVATGAGNALYQGNHPVTRGYDADFVGLIADIQQVTHEPSQLTVESERRLMKVGRGLIRDSDPVSLASLHARKLAAFVFVTKAYPFAEDLRSWRIALLILAAIGFAGMRDPRMRWLLAGILAYQVASYIPVLYTHRYSVAMDPWLLIAAGVGIATLWSRRRAWEMATAIGVLIVAVGVGRYLAAKMEPPDPDVFAAARVVVWDGAPRRIAFATDNPMIEIPIRNTPLFSPVNANVLVVDAALQPGVNDHACGHLGLSYRRDDGRDTGYELERMLPPDGQVHRLQLGTLRIALNAEGVLRLRLECAKGGALDIRRIVLYTPVAGLVYAQRYLGIEPYVRLPVEE